jgi:methionine-S-sulfoxide reductase
VNRKTAALLLLAAAGCGGPLREPSRMMNAPAVPALDAAAPARTETATFALGCFWCPDAQFGILPGVVRTRVGYAGGTTPNPTYHDLGDHTECVQIDYDPAKLTFDQVLDRIWTSHNPCVRTEYKQYRNAIFYASDAQKKAIEDSKERKEKELGKPIKTVILPLSRFYVAEDYHQKYELRCTEGLIEEFKAIYPDPKDLCNSTAAARVNGYIAGRGTREQFKAEGELLGLSPEGRKRLEIYLLK